MKLSAAGGSQRIAAQKKLAVARGRLDSPWVSPAQTRVCCWLHISMTGILPRARRRRAARWWGVSSWDDARPVRRILPPREQMRQQGRDTKLQRESRFEQRPLTKKHSLHLISFRRTAYAVPRRPEPRRIMLPGSGTGATGVPSTSNDNSHPAIAVKLPVLS